MKTRIKPSNLRRRDFLVRGAVTMGAAATLAVVGRADAAPVEPVNRTGSPVTAGDESGYRLTPHIKEYYAKARF